MLGLLWRLAIVVPMLAYSFHETCPIFLPIVLIFASAFILGPQVTRLLVEPAGSLFMPDEKAAGPSPLYGIPERQKAKGKYEEAMAEYQKLVEQFPGEVKAYVEMINIAAFNFKNMEQAYGIYQRALATVEDEDKKKALSTFFRHLRGKFKDGTQKFPAPSEGTRPPSARPLKLPNDGFRPAR